MFVEHLPSARRGSRRIDGRAQAHTLEAFMAALLLVAGLIIATQATAVTPLSASTSNQHIENQEAIGAADVLATTNERGDLRETLLYWEDGEFVGADDPGYYTGMVDDENPVHGAFEEAFDARGVAFNVDVLYFEEDGTRDDQRMVDQGDPSDNAATASIRVPLYTDDELHGGDSIAAETYFAPPDSDARGTLYTVVEVRIVVWRV